MWEKRLMARLTRGSPRRAAARSLVASLRHFLTPALWKQARQARGPRRQSRWGLQPLALVLLGLTWACGDSGPERFETARAFVAACLPKRRRPGKTVSGFQKALARLPMPVLRVLAAGVRRRVPGVPSRGPVGAAPGPGRPVGGGPHAVADGPGAFTAGGAVGLALGPGHGQRARPPAADAAGAAGRRPAGGGRRLRRLRPDADAAAAAGVFFDPHVVQGDLLPGGAGAAVALPRRGGVLLAAVQEEGRIAVGAGARAADPGAGAAGPTRRVAGDQRAGPGPAVGGAGGPVLPLAVGERGAVPDVQADAGQDEVAQPDRAAGASGGRGLAAGDAAAFGAGGAGSARRVLLAVREELRAPRPRRGACFGRRLSAARREERQRDSAKVQRDWPRRTPNRPPKPPRLLTLGEAEKARILRHETEAA